MEEGTKGQYSKLPEGQAYLFELLLCFIQKLEFLAYL